MEIIHTSEFLATRDHFSRISCVPRGRYVLVPCTLEAEVAQSFLLRVLAKAGALTVKELVLDRPQKTFLSRKAPSAVTYVKVLGAKDLVKKPHFSGNFPIETWVAIKNESGVFFFRK